MQKDKIFTRQELSKKILQAMKIIILWKFNDARPYDLIIRDFMILWVNDVWFYDFMIIWCSTLWSNDSWFYDYGLKFKKVIDDYGVIPSGPFERSSKECWAALKKTRGGKTPTNRWSSNFKPPPKPQTDVFRRVVPLYIPFHLWFGKFVRVVRVEGKTS